jgi:CheY-like chemotaxis protein
MSVLFVLDDDPAFHRIIELSLSKSRPFRDVYHYYEAKPLINYLWANMNDRSNLPDIIFVDIRMPIADGWDFMDALQKIFPTLCKKITVYVVSVSVIKNDVIRAAQYPFVQEFISKPITTSKLASIALEMANV